MAGYDDLSAKFRTGSVRMGVIGLGYVGLPLCIASTNAGLNVTGFDIDEAKVVALNLGLTVIRSVKDQLVKRMVQTGRFTATGDFDKLAEMDAVLICVPTPLGHHREPDLKFVMSASEITAKTLRRGQLVILESSTFPGTTDEVVRPILERTGLKCGEDFFLAYSPEREDPGNPVYTTSNTPRVVGADDPKSGDLAEALYGRIVTKVIRVENSRVAEAVKITENTFRSVNIALMNELKVIYARMGINIWDVIEAAKSKPFGFMPFYPGPGLGGHCIPIDPYYLTWKAKEFDIATRFVELAGDINSAMPYQVVELVADGLSTVHKKGLSGASLLLVGLAYKKNLDDLRESPALKIWVILEKRGVKVSYYDPYIPVVPKTREYGAFADVQSIGWTKDAVGRFDAVIVTTDHDAVDYAQMTEWAQLVFDSRNATRSLPKELKRKVILV